MVKVFECLPLEVTRPRLISYSIEEVEAAAPRLSSAVTMAEGVFFRVAVPSMLLEAAACSSSRLK